MTFYMYVSNVFIRVSPQKNQYYTYVSKFFFASVSNQNLSSSSFFGSTFLSSFLPWIDQYPSLSFLKIDTIKRITFSLLCLQYYQTPLLGTQQLCYILCVYWKVVVCSDKTLCYKSLFGKLKLASSILFILGY